MAKEKQYVFSARTTEEGLGLLNKLKANLGIGWDELVVEAVCTHYGLDKAVMVLPKPERPKKEPEPKAEKPKAKAQPKAKKTKAREPSKQLAEQTSEQATASK